MQPDASNVTDIATVAKMKLPNGDYLMPDGSVISEKKIVQPAVSAGVEILSARKSKAVLQRMHRKLGDLPQEPQQKLNAIAAIIMYTNVGLSDADIAVALGASKDAIESIKALESYKQLADMFDATVFEDAKKNASHIIARAADQAATRLVEAIDDPNSLVAVGASREVVKMAGVSLEGSSGKNKSGLHIKIVRKGEKRDDETITVELNNAS